MNNPDQKLKEFDELVGSALEELFQAAKAKGEFAYVFALLGINSGVEDAGWQPIAETWMLLDDFIGLSNAPFSSHTEMRLLLTAYCQITEANYPYHILYNMLLSIEGKSPPKIFNFLDEYRNAVPPPVKEKVKKISTKTVALNHPKIKQILDNIFSVEIRNAVSHADYILYQDELRLKHRGSQIKKIKLDDTALIISKAIIFFKKILEKISEHKKSYNDGYVIKNRKCSSGSSLSSITISADPKHGITGFGASDPLPLW